MLSTPDASVHVLSAVSLRQKEAATTLENLRDLSIQCSSMFSSHQRIA